MDNRPIPEYSEAARSVVQGGTYQHYKGPRYVVLHVARGSETLEELVVYKDSKGNVWVRPLDMFVETILVDGASKPRFALVKS